jgi:two-component system OmpR family response regulator
MVILKLLYVEDEPDLRELVEFALALDPEIDLRTAASGKDGLRQLVDSPADAVLLDVMMPEMDGPSVLAAMSEDPNLRGIPAVFVTARALPDEIARLMALGAAGVVTKPFDAATLARDIRALLGRAHG